MFGRKAQSAQGVVHNLQKEVKVVNPYVRHYVVRCNLVVEDASPKLSIQIEIHGPTGPTVPGELRGPIMEGDTLEVTGKMNGQVLRVKHAFNRTRGCPIV